MNGEIGKPDVSIFTQWNVLDELDGSSSGRNAQRSRREYPRV
jgi:hypothetical protein